MCPNSSRNFRDGFFLRLQICHRVDDNILFVCNPIKDLQSNQSGICRSSSRSLSSSRIIPLDQTKHAEKLKSNDRGTTPMVKPADLRNRDHLAAVWQLDGPAFRAVF